MSKLTRKALLAHFHDMIEQKKPIIGGGAGTGLSARCEEAGGIDLIVIYNSGRYRMAGRGSLAGLLAYGNANEIVKEMAREVLPVVKHTPVLAGVNGTDPFMIRGHFLDELKALGFAGIQNFPTVGLFDGLFRKNLEETGMGYGLEVELVAAANAKDMLTTPYVFNPDEATAMTKAGADIIVAHMGLTTGGNIGAETALNLPDCVPLIAEIAEAARRVRKDVIVLCHGGPISSPEDAAYILRNTKGIHGFYGASSMERLPTERALTLGSKPGFTAKSGIRLSHSSRKIRSSVRASIEPTQRCTPPPKVELAPGFSRSKSTLSGSANLASSSPSIWVGASTMSPCFMVIPSSVKSAFTSRARIAIGKRRSSSSLALAIRSGLSTSFWRCSGWVARNCA